MPPAMNTLPAPVLVIAIGNESRGDDALAPLLLHRIADCASPHQVELLEDFQLQIEHAADLAGRKLVLFMDAGMDTPAPYLFYRAQAHESHGVFSHALTPEAVLATYCRVYRLAAPPAYVLCIRGEQFELGATLSRDAEMHMEVAVNFVRTLLSNAEPSVWEVLCPRMVR